MKILSTIVLVFLVNIPSAGARTWSVEKDGSGDFTTLQPATDAAASGDTIRIGPGRYNEVPADYCKDDVADARMMVGQEVLTIIGAGPEQTFIGPEGSYQHSQGPQIGIVGIPMCGNSILYIRDICFESLMHAVHAEYTDIIDIENCDFSRNYIALVSDCRKVVVKGSKTNVAIEWGAFIIAFSGRMESMIVDECESECWPAAYQIGATPSNEMTISNCKFIGGTGLSIGGNRNINIFNCDFSGQRNYSIKLRSGVATINHCKITGSDSGIYLALGGGALHGTDIEFSNMGRATLLYHGFPSGFMHKCILDKGEEFVVAFSASSGPQAKSELKTRPETFRYEPTKADPYSEKIETRGPYFGPNTNRFDMTHNNWGTSDPDSIQAWIEDGSDLPNYPYYVDWKPYVDDLVPTTRRKMGGIRAMFR